MTAQWPAGCGEQLRRCVPLRVLYGPLQILPCAYTQVSEVTDRLPIQHKHNINYVTIMLKLSHTVTKEIIRNEACLVYLQLCRRRGSAVDRRHQVGVVCLKTQVPLQQSAPVRSSRRRASVRYAVD